MAIAILYDSTTNEVKKIALQPTEDDVYKEVTMAATFTATPIPTVSGGTGSGATITSITVTGSGEIETVTWNSGGTAYATGDVLKFTQNSNFGYYTLIAADHTSGVLGNWTGKDIIARTTDTGHSYASVDTSVWNALTEKPTVDGAWSATVDANDKATAFARMTVASATLKTQVLKDARTHARACIDAMRPDWNRNFESYRTATDQSPADQLAMNDRYLNTWFWIMSGLKAIKEAHDDSGWTGAQLEGALDAYRALVPVDNIITWYTAHNRVIWAAYRQPDSTNSNRIRCYFKWTKGAATPAFASDATSSTAWDGTSNTEDAYLTTFDVQPETLA